LDTSDRQRRQNNTTLGCLSLKKAHQLFSSNLARGKSEENWPEEKMATGEFYFWVAAAAGVNFASLNN